MNVSNKLIVGLNILALGLLVSVASHAAEGEFAKKHPRRAEVLKRDKNLKNKTTDAEASGKITGAQANKLNRQENQIKRQEQRDAAKNGGHITKAEQAGLNKEENHVNGELKHDEAKDAGAGGGAGAGTPPPAGGTGN